MDPRLQPGAHDAAPWYLAVTLDERAAATASFDPDAIERGRLRLQTWVDELGISAEVLERRLETSDLEPDALYGSFGVDAAELQQAVDPPQWLIELLACLAEPPAPASLPDWDGAPDSAPFLRLVEPMLCAGLERLLERIAGVHGAAAIQREQLLAPIRRRLLQLLERPLILELHAAVLLGAIPTTTPQRQFADFVASLQDPSVRITILQQYPVMARQAWDWVTQWVDATSELFAAIDRDRSRLTDTFGELGPPVGVEAVGSDPHRGGRHVWFVDFAAGTRLVYKPRPCAVEATFQRHVAALDESGLRPQLATLRVVDEPEHGWMEFAAATPASGLDGLREFHRRQGAWLAVLWTVACTDVHYENLIAAGDHPIPVDHESLLRNRVFTAPGHDAQLHAEEWLGDSIYGVDILPAPKWDAGFGGMIDQAGMGAGYDEAGTVVIDRVVDAGTSQMRVDRAQIIPERQVNRAEHDGSYADPRDWVDEIEDGFRAAWTHLDAHSGELAELIGRFAGAPVRLILRPTQTYLTILRSMGHPEFLQDAVERERALMQLWTYPRGHEWRRGTVESERRQMLSGDVPWFGAVSGARAIISGDGRTFPDAIVRTGIEVALGRVRSMSPELLERQIWVLRSSLARWGTGTPIGQAPILGGPGEVADEIARRLIERSIAADGQRTWLCMSLVGGDGPAATRYRPAPAACDLYDGLPGVALFLAAHGTARGSEASLQAAREAAATLLQRGLGPVDGIGAYDGAGGIMWSAIQLAAWLDDASLLDLASAAADRIAAGLEHDRTFDVVSGAAGCIPVLIELERRRPGAIELASACGAHLCEHVHGPESLRFARGFSHGLAGVAWALARLAEATGDERWLDHALALADREDDLLVGGRWTDSADGSRAQMAAWCHGAPGIALSRLELARISEREHDREMADAALTATCSAPVHDTHGMCHGELGLVEVLGVAARYDEVGDSAGERARRAERVLAQIAADGPRCTTPRWLETPGLMNGLSGIGWAMLRLDAPEEVPTVLLPGSAGRAPVPGSSRT